MFSDRCFEEGGGEGHPGGALLSYLLEVILVFVFTGQVLGLLEKGLREAWLAFGQGQNCCLKG